MLDKLLEREKHIKHLADLCVLRDCFARSDHRLDVELGRLAVDIRGHGLARPVLRSLQPT